MSLWFSHQGLVGIDVPVPVTRSPSVTPWIGESAKARGVAVRQRPQVNARPRDPAALGAAHEVPGTAHGVEDQPGPRAKSDGKSGHENGCLCDLNINMIGKW